MSELIKLGCTVADAYHRYHEIHGAVFGVSYLRQVIDTVRGKPHATFGDASVTLKALRGELTELEPRITDPKPETPTTGADRELRNALLEYTRALSQSVAQLEQICTNLGQDETAYRVLGADGRSRFTLDKLHYDQQLSELARLGTRLEKIFANY